jgi:hypothetical protein
MTIGFRYTSTASGSLGVLQQIFSARYLESGGVIRHLGASDDEPNTPPK